MTVFTKPSIIASKAGNAKIPLVEEKLCPEAKIALPGGPPPKVHPFRRTVTMLFHFMNISLLLMLFVAIGVVVYRQCNKPYRYQGYCAVPIDIRFENQVDGQRMIPLQWSADPDINVISGEEGEAEEFMNILREELDIEGMIEKISVVNNGHQVSFIHDFSTNLSNIVDTDRCFTMELDPDLVLVPDAFVLSIERDGKFDITRVRSALKALLPALHDVTLMPPQCRTRPTYRLQREANRIESSVPVRKRSVGAPLRTTYISQGSTCTKLKSETWTNFSTTNKTIRPRRP